MSFLQSAGVVVSAVQWEGGVLLEKAIGEISRGYRIPAGLFPPICHVGMRTEEESVHTQGKGEMSWVVKDNLECREWGNKTSFSPENENAFSWIEDQK